MLNYKIINGTDKFSIIFYLFIFFMLMITQKNFLRQVISITISDICKYVCIYFFIIILFFYFIFIFIFIFLLFIWCVQHRQ